MQNYIGNGRYLQKKYACKNCGKKEMTLNIQKNCVNGYICIKCGVVNYPIKDSMSLIK